MKTNYLNTGDHKKMNGGFFQKLVDGGVLQRTAESPAVVPIGYGATGFLGSTPLWLQDLTGLLELGAVVFAVLVGATTLYINVLNILERKEKRRERGSRSRKIT